MRAADALAEHTRIANALSNQAARSWVGLMLNESLGQADVVDVELIGRMAQEHTRDAYTFHLSANMNDEVLRHVEELAPETPFSTYPPPTECGVLVLDSPWVLYDIRGRELRFTSVSWGPAPLWLEQVNEVTTGTLIVMWQDTRRAHDDYTDVLHADHAFQEIKPLLDDMNVVMTGVTASIMPMGLPEDVAGDRSRPRSLYHVGERLAAAWDLMDQTIPAPDAPDQEPIQRHVRRQAARAGMTVVRVVPLRRASRSRHTGAGTPLDHRVEVREHYRHYWIRDPQTFERTRVLRKIKKHVRGPEGAPLVKQPTVYDLRR